MIGKGCCVQINTTILFRDNKGQGCPFRGPAWFKDTNLNHVVEFLFKGMLMDTRNRVSSVVHWFSSKFEVNVKLFMGIDSQKFIK